MSEPRTASERCPDCGLSIEAGGCARECRRAMGVTMDEKQGKNRVVCPCPCYGGVLITKLEIGGMEGEVREFGPCPLCNANDESGAVALAREAWAQRHAVSGNGVT